MKVRFYGILRDYAGRSEVELEIEDSLEEEELLDLLAKKLPGLREVKEYVERGELTLLLLVDGKPVRKGERIGGGTVVDLLPPAAGG